MLVWVGVVPASLLLGPVVRAVSPVRTINLLLAKAHRWRRGSGAGHLSRQAGLLAGCRRPDRVRVAGAGQHQSAYLGSVRIWLAAYLAIMLVGAAIFGDEWLERADPFEVYSACSPSSPSGAATATGW